MIRRFGRAAVLSESELGAYLTLRLREKHGGDVQLERTEPLNEFESVPDSIRDAAAAYESRDHPIAPYTKFASGTDHPSPEAMRETEL